MPDLSNISAILLPTNLPWDIFIYLIFFLSLITLVLVPDKNLQPTLIMSLVLLMTIIDKVRSSGSLPIQGFDDRGFATLMIHIGMFALPFIAAGLVRGRGKNDKRAIGPALLTGLIGGVYGLGFFLVVIGVGDF